MGSRTTPVQPVRPFNKPTQTPPAIKKQLSVPGSGSPARKFSGSQSKYTQLRIFISRNILTASQIVLLGFCN